MILIHLELALNLLLLCWMASIIYLNRLVLLLEQTITEVEAFLLWFVYKALAIIVDALGKTRVVLP